MNSTQKLVWQICNHFCSFTVGAILVILFLSPPLHIWKWCRKETFESVELDIHCVYRNEQEYLCGSDLSDH